MQRHRDRTQGLTWIQVSPWDLNAIFVVLRRAPRPRGGEPEEGDGDDREDEG